MKSLLPSLLLVIPLCVHGVEIQIDPQQTHQTIEGFGSCFSINGSGVTYINTEGFLDAYLDEIGASAVRINIRGHVIPQQADPGSLSWRDMVLSDRAQVAVRTTRRLVEREPKLRVIATAWTPPDWMKVNRSETGHAYKRGAKKQNSSAINEHSYKVTKNNRIDDNRVDPKYYPHLAQWAVEVVRFYQDQGVELYGLSFANEPCFSQFFGSCVWTTDDYAAMFKLLAERMRDEGFGHIKLFGPETMSHRDSRSTNYLKAMQANGSIEYLHALATHGYVDGVKTEMADVSSIKQKAVAKSFDVAYWMTEGGTGEHDWPAPITNGVATALHNSLVAGDASLFTPWQFSGKGASTHNLRLTTGPTKKTWAATHFFRFVRPGFQRVETTPAFGDLLTSAFIGENQQLVVVMINAQGQGRQAKLAISDFPGEREARVYRTSANEDLAELPTLEIVRGAAGIDLPGHSIVTVVIGPR